MPTVSQSVSERGGEGRGEGLHGHGYVVRLGYTLLMVPEFDLSILLKSSLTFYTKDRNKVTVLTFAPVFVAD